MNDFEFSVLIPVYIKENPQHLQLAFQSVIDQTLPPNEIVIVEDGILTNELYAVIELFKNQYPQIFLIVKLQQNSGMGIAMNEGLKVCKYNWVARMDSDDICVNTRFEQQINFLSKHKNIDIVGGYIEEFQHIVGDLKQVRHLPTEHNAIKQFAKYRNPLNHMTVMFNKHKAIEAGGYWHHRLLEDYHLWFMMLVNNCQFANLPQTLVNARVGNNMLGRRKGLPYLKMEIFFFKKMLKQKFINYPQFIKAILSRAVMKIIPIQILEKMYSWLLRNKQNSNA